MSEHWPALTALSLAHDETIDLRYAAFTSIERAGPTPQSIAVLRQIAHDDALGDSPRFDRLYVGVEVSK